MEVSFIIPLYNCLAHTREALRTLQATLPVGLAHEIVLVDDGSTDGTREWLKAAGPALGAGLSSDNQGRPASGSPAIRAIFNEKNLGFAGACNRGAAAATGEFLFFLNNDLVFRPGWFGPMRAVFDRRPDAGLVGNVQLDAATGAVDHAGLFFDHKGKPAHLTARPWPARLTGLRPVAALTGACFAIRTATWRQLGGCDEGFVNGGEDVDLCLRARAAGWRNYIALRSTVRHHVSASPGRKLRDEQNSRRLALRWRREIAALAARDWSRHFIETHWDRSCLFDDQLARAALYCWLGLLPAPPSNVLTGVAAALEQELARWAKMLGPAPDH